MSSVPGRAVVVGGGQAAASAIASLRHWKYAGEITLIGDENALPYQRPPLSKGYMKGEVDRDRLILRPADWYRENNVEVHTGLWAREIDVAARRVVHDSGASEYDALVLTTGSRARLMDIPGSQSKNVLYLRNLADVDRIRPHLVEGRRMVVIGAGYIGLEAAAAARQCGLSVTVLEYAPRVLARVTSPLMSDFFENEHRARGVDIVTDARIESLVASEENVTAVDLADGTRLPCDVVLIGIGIVPNVELASAAGLECDDGIVVDRDARTSHESIYAAGDVTSRPLVHYGRRGRLESVHNAIEQGKLAAASILGRPRPPEDCPWFWSDQFDLKLQIAGLSQGYSSHVVRGSESDRQFAVYYLDGESRLLAVDAVNAPQDFVLSKRLIIAGATVDPDQLADQQVPLKEIVSAALAG
jgi:3-phenylpropionate/trans-cinnamate dioxygenase ferredoxin reductase subunit